MEQLDRAFLNRNLVLVELQLTCVIPASHPTRTMIRRCAGSNESWHLWRTNMSVIQSRPMTYPIEKQF